MLEEDIISVIAFRQKLPLLGLKKVLNTGNVSFYTTYCKYGEDQNISTLTCLTVRIIIKKTPLPKNFW